MTADAKAADVRTGPLSGLTVIDVTHMLAGPYCTWLLGALGADVIKIERPGHGDHTRSLEPKLDGESLYFLSVNRNKRSLALDLKSKDGRAIFEKLVSRADILVENNRPGVMSRLGLGYEDLSRINSRLIYASISGFGQSGPFRERPAFDAVIQAMAGMMSVTGETNRPPSRVGASIGDMAASLFAALGIVSAVHERSRTGRGAMVDVAMLDAQVSLLENAFSRFLNTGLVPQRIGSRHPLVTPFQAFETSDEAIVICCDTEPQWQAMCRVVGRRDLVDDPRFGHNNLRTINHAALEPILAVEFRNRSRAEWLGLLQASDVPCGPVNTIEDIAADPQIAARGMLVRVGAGKFVTQPIRTGSIHPAGETRAPRLGEHSRDILASLGYSAEAIARLEEAAVITSDVPG
jgi:crotonobetainyl-CoA:carnitine CoA-transferase CaiB-like acyl-CoA transferase